MFSILFLGNIGVLHIIADKQSEKQVAQLLKQLQTAEATVQSSNSSFQSSGDMPADKADSVADVNVAEAIAGEETQATTEKVDSFCCKICDFASKWENGLNIHTSKKACYNSTAGWVYR